MSIIYVAPLQTALAVSIREAIFRPYAGGSAIRSRRLSSFIISLRFKTLLQFLRQSHRQECLCHIHFDAFGQTNNYFTSRAHAVMVWESPVGRQAFPRELSNLCR